MTLDFTGTVSDISDEGVLDSSVSLGTPFQLHVVYDDSAPASEVDGHQSSWIFPVPPSQMSLGVGSYLAQTGPLSGDPTLPIGFQAFLFDDSPGGGDSYMISAGGPVSGGSPSLIGGFGVLLYDSTGTTLDSSELSNVSFDIGAWDPVDHAVSLVLHDPTDPSGREAAVFGQLESIAVQRVPEPSGAVLIAAALAALGALVRITRQMS